MVAVPAIFSYASTAREQPVMDASNARVIAAYEKRIEELEISKLTLAEKQAGMAKPLYTFEQLFELSMRFLSSPCKLWVCGCFAMQRTGLKPAFAERLGYCRETGFRTPETSVPFRVSGGISGQKTRWCCDGGLNSRPHPYQCVFRILGQALTRVDDVVEDRITGCYFEAFCAVGFA